MKSKKSVKNSTNIKTPKKYILIIGLSLIFVFVILLSTKLNPGRLLGSVYNVTDVESNIDKIKVGDTINYEINGYSDWQVIYIDKNNNTIEVVSKTNTEDITLQTKDDYTNALDIFQETANKYIDGKYAIKARSVSRTDLDNFAFDEEFWNADIYDGAVAYTNGAIKYTEFENDPHTYKYMPYVIINDVENAYNYSIGNDYNININGITDWLIINIPSYNKLSLIPQTPIELSFETNEEFRENPVKFTAEYIEEIKNSNEKVVEVGNISDKYGFWIIRDNENIRNHYMESGNILKLFTGYYEMRNQFTYKEVGGNVATIDFENNTDYCCDWESYKTENPITKGFRPVVTLKYSDKLVEGKNISSDLQIGDNVNYGAKEYYNWRVLSIDEENETVDIISGGIVKNVSLYGLDNFEDYEDILQKEVDEYKNGDNVISARVAEYSDIKNLNKMNDDVNVKYWSLEKKQYNKKAVDETSSPYATNGYYEASIMYYDFDTNSVERKWVQLYVSTSLTSGTSSMLTGYNGYGDLSFTAGIRPIITLKLEDVKKLNEEDTQNAIDSSKANENNIVEEQNNSNNNIINDNQNNTTENITNNEKNNTEITNDNEVNNYYNNYGHKSNNINKIIKYIIITIVILNIAVLLQIIFSVLIINKMKKNKKRK